MTRYIIDFNEIAFHCKIGLCQSMWNKVINSILQLQGHDENLQQAEHLVEDFCQAVGAKVNWDKTQGL